MKHLFNISSKGFLNSIKEHAKIATFNSTIDVIQNIHFKTNDNVLTITSNNLIEVVSTKLLIYKEIDSIEDMEFLVNAKILLDAIKTLPEQSISFFLKNEVIAFKHSAGIFNLTSFVDKDILKTFPISHSLDGATNSISFGVKEFTNIVNYTIPMLGKDELRPVFNGINFKVENNVLTIVSTDTNRLCIYEKDFKHSDFNVLIPGLSLKKVLGFCSEASEISIEFNEFFSKFNISNNIMYVRNIENKFPEIKSVIPKDNDKVLTINKVNLLNVIKRVSVFANKSTNLIVFDISENEFTIEANDIEYSNSAKEEVNYYDYVGEPLKIGFNSKYLISILSVIESENIKIEMSSNLKAILITPQNNTFYTFLLMPALISEDK